MLLGVCGQPSEVNAALLAYAIEHAPVILVDCANCAIQHFTVSYAAPLDSPALNTCCSKCWILLTSSCTAC
ncbi:hypothetical protein HY490_03835 [Candidatus Woesearchaeota archaeon]|nr:hypothetical protein [Candidatus Woesearchaeota archaeon]